MAPEMQELFGTHGLACDITEVLGLDDIHAPNDQCLAAQELAAAAYGSEYCYFLVNGSTVGNQAMFLAALDPGDTVILPRACHRSVFAALTLSGARAHFMASGFEESILTSLPPSLEDLRSALKACPQAKALFLTSPSYHGLTPDLDSLITEAHQSGLIVLVDEAWGGHLAFHPRLPSSALDFGADLVCQSVHKMTCGLTQSALLHSQGNSELQTRLRSVLSHLQTSSPSSLLVASIDCARRQMVLEGRAMWTEALELSEFARRGIQSITGLFCFQQSERNWDSSRLIINATERGYSGYALAHYLRNESKIQVEMWEAHQVLLLLQPGHTKADIDHLLTALNTLPPRELEFDFAQLKDCSRAVLAIDNQLQPNYTFRELFYKSRTSKSLHESVDRLSAELLYCYPPGVPLLYPGQPISEDILDFVRTQLRLGGTINGGADPSLDTILVLEGL